MRARGRKGFGWKRWSSEWLYDRLGLFNDYQLRRWSGCESRPSTIGHITLGTKQTGAPSAGNPHAGCDVAGAGNGFTVWLLRHSQRKRGATARPDLRNTAPVLDPTLVLYLERSATRQCAVACSWAGRFGYSDLKEAALMEGYVL